MSRFPCRFPRRLLRLAPVALLALAVTSCDDDNGAAPAPAPPEPPVPEAVDVPNALDIVIADMDGAHEGFPRGVLTDGGEAWSWVYHPRVSYGNTLPEGWDATIPWGQVYADTAGGGASGVRFQIRNLRQYLFSRADSTWSLISDTPDDIDGANYAEDFQDDDNVSAEIRAASADGIDGGGITAAIQTGYNFHFFARGRARIDPDDVGGMWSVFEARIAPGQSGSAYQPALLASGGGDYWEATDSEWDQWKTNGDWAIGRFKYLTAGWRPFNAHTLDAETLRRFPPPGLD